MGAARDPRAVAGEAVLSRVVVKITRVEGSIFQDNSAGVDSLIVQKRDREDCPGGDDGNVIGVDCVVSRWVVSFLD